MYPQGGGDRHQRKQHPLPLRHRQRHRDQDQEPPTAVRSQAIRAATGENIQNIHRTAGNTTRVSPLFCASPSMSLRPPSNGFGGLCDISGSAQSKGETLCTKWIIDYKPWIFDYKCMQTQIIRDHWYAARGHVWKSRQYILLFLMSCHLPSLAIAAEVHPKFLYKWTFFALMWPVRKRIVIW